MILKGSDISLLSWSQVRAYLDPIGGGVEQHLELGDEVGGHQLVSEFRNFGDVAEKSHHVPKEVVFVGKLLE